MCQLTEPAEEVDKPANPRDGKKQLHLDICCIVKALSSSFSLLPPSSFTPKTLIYHSSSNVITISTSN
ncbi:hypothetical protein FOBRF1_010311 [Fusarium oxysporum]